MMSLNSKRKYRVITVVTTANEPLVEDFEISLGDILETGSETCYSLQEQIDDVMDIPENCTMYFKPNRDDHGSKGILIRIK